MRGCPLGFHFCCCNGRTASCKLTPGRQDLITNNARKMKAIHTTLVVFCITSALMCCQALTAHADVSKQATWTVASGGNGHTYRVVAKTGLISWDSANGEAQAAGGYLSTITSAA